MTKETADKLIKDGWNPDDVAKFMQIKSCRKKCYKIVLTGDKDGYSISHLAEHPGDGEPLDTIYFCHPDQLDEIVAAYEGLFYQLFDIHFSYDLPVSAGTVDNLVWEMWLDDACTGKCRDCFLRIAHGDGKYGCRKNGSPNPVRQVDITKQDVRVTGLSAEDGGCLEADCTLWMDADLYFGTDTKKNDSWVRLYCVYNPATGCVMPKVLLDSPSAHAEEICWDFTDAEEKFFRKKMDAFVLKKYGKRLKNLKPGDLQKGD
ncbi:MAG: hypothetical protein LUE14_04565 [Clostridiales bacterium]|nr:hypothetical protein [Clostridiales bacterium]